MSGSKEASGEVNRLLQFSEEYEAEVDVDVVLRKNAEWRRHVAEVCVHSQCRTALLGLARRYFGRWLQGTHDTLYTAHSAPHIHEQCEAALQTCFTQIRALKEENASLRTEPLPILDAHDLSAISVLEETIAERDVRLTIVERECSVKVSAARKQFEEAHTLMRQMKVENEEAVHLLGVEQQRVENAAAASERAREELRAENKELLRKLTQARAEVGAAEDSCNAKLLGMGGMITSLQIEVEALRRGDTRTPPGTRRSEGTPWQTTPAKTDVAKRLMQSEETCAALQRRVLHLSGCEVQAFLSSEACSRLSHEADAAAWWAELCRAEAAAAVGETRTRGRKADKLAEQLQTAELSAVKAAEAIQDTNDKAHELETMLSRQHAVYDARKDSSRAYEVKYAVLKEKYRTLQREVSDCIKQRDTSDRELRFLLQERARTVSPRSSPSPHMYSYESPPMHAYLTSASPNTGSEPVPNTAVRQSPQRTPSPLRDYRTRYNVKW